MRYLGIFHALGSRIHIVVLLMYVEHEVFIFLLFRSDNNNNNKDNIGNNIKNQSKNIHCSSVIQGRLFSIVSKFWLMKLAKCIQWLLVSGGVRQIAANSGQLVVGFRKFRAVSDGFGWFHMVSGGSLFSSYHNKIHLNDVLVFISLFIYCVLRVFCLS